MLLGEVCEPVHQIAERFQWLGNAARHAVNLFHTFDRFEERDAMRIRVSGHQTFRTRPKPTLRDIEDTPHVHVVRGIHDGLQVRDGVLDLPAFVEFGTANELIWQIGVNHRFFQGTRLRVGTVHDGDVPVGDVLLGVDPRDLIRDPSGLLTLVIRRIADDLVPLAEVTPQFLRFAVLVF